MPFRRPAEILTPASVRRPDLSIRCPDLPPAPHLTNAKRQIPSTTTRTVMTNRLHYGTPAKVLHWLVVTLLAVQFPIGWFMPDVHGGPPGRAMTLHISFGISILALICLLYTSPSP